ncbi:conserved hypothetical protein [Beijerinckia indica subsp. indica ATCC 9039]|uniref:Transporter n=2 Tax=Beijerinckia TaxID=532 RepID=B2IIQ0_BEII9|nr:conserved hypothetical protein [Beijerinckia indica subsp. indica ATCC 9039]
MNDIALSSRDRQTKTSFATGKTFCLFLFCMSGVAMTETSHADDAHSEVDKSQYSLFNPTPDSALRPFVTDRPTKSNSPYTVDAGRFQYEMDLYNAVTTSAQGQTTYFGQTLDPVLKLGLTSQIDFEFQPGGLVNARTLDHASGQQVSHLYGFGDTVLRTKFNLFGDDGGDQAMALILYGKLPSARAGLGNGLVEGGAILPWSISLPQDFTLLFMPEIDILKNNNDSRRHANFVNLINISHPVPFVKDLTFAAEFFTSVSADRGTPNIYTLDFALSYIVVKDLQLDGGINIGLNRDAPNLQLYAGISQRF